MKSRFNVISMTICAMVIFLLLINSQGYNATWKMFGITPMKLHFGDTRVITHGAEAYSQGLDPMVENPGDPLRRRLNYPRVWQLLYPLGLDETHTTAMGMVIILSFWIGLCLLLPHASKWTLTVVFAAALSPAVLLGMERGNIDLFMFFLIALSVWAIPRSHFVAGTALLAAFVLKLFPLLAWLVLLRLAPPQFRRMALILSGLAGLYLLATFSDVLLVIDGTPRATVWSYGMNVCWMAVGEFDPLLGANLQMLSWFLVLLALLAAFSALLRDGPVPDNTSDPLHLDAFRAGAGIYVGTFLIGNNWDYRLIFLILTLPQILWWAKGPGGRRILAWVTLTAIMLSFWHMLLIKMVFGYEDGYQTGFLLDELANWTAFAGLAYLLFATAPAWVKETVRSLRPSQASA